MKRTKGIPAALLAGALWLIGCAAAFAQEDTRNLVDLFYTYTNDNVIVSYEDSNELLPDWSVRFRLYNGFLALSQTDLDWDGEEELLAVRLKPMDGESGEKQNMLIAEVYRRRENSLQRVAQYTLAEDILRYTQADVDVFAVNGAGGQVLCCEAKDSETLTATGIGYSLCAAEFENDAFRETEHVSLLGSDFTQEQMDEVSSAISGLGLQAAEPVTQMLAQQTEGLGMICSIDRYISDYDGAIAYLNSGSQEAFVYGATSFVSYMNPERENKLPGEFAVSDAPSAPAAQTEGTAGDGYHYEGDYVILDSDSRYITEEELHALSADEIFLARNEIYARHGRIFHDAALDAYFRSRSWYTPTVDGSDFTDDYAARIFNDYEIKNISTLVTYEKDHGLNGYE